MTLRGNLGTRRLVANRAGDRLVAGPNAADHRTIKCSWLQIRR